MAFEVRPIKLPFDLRTSYDNEVHYKAAHEEGKFLIPHCKDCGKYYWPAAFICEYCGSSNVEWVEASGQGRLYSKVEERFPFHRAIKEYLPIGLCSVILDEGPRVFGRLLGYDKIEDVPYDAPVHLVWLRDEERGATIMGWELD
jgi:uncharacterized OB-fold protein